MVADEDGHHYKSIEEEHFLDVDELERYEIFLAEKEDGVEVILADRDEAVDQGGEVRGDFERSLSEFLHSSEFCKDERTHEAYMSDCADLAEHGVPDTACRRTLVGESVLQRMSEALRQLGLRVRFVRENHEFRFGNSGTLSTKVSALIPVCLGGKQLAIRAAVLPGAGSETPLLLSKELLRKLQVKLDMGDDRIEIGRYGVSAKLRETERGHYALPLFKGLEQCRSKGNVPENAVVKTHEVNAAEFSAQATVGSVREVQSEPEQHELRGSSRDGYPHGNPCSLDVDRGSDVRGDGKCDNGGSDVGYRCEDPRRGSRSQRRRQRRRCARSRRVSWTEDLQRGQVPEAGGTHDVQAGVRRRQEIRGVGEKIHQGTIGVPKQDEPPDHDAIPALHRHQGPSKVAAHHVESASSNCDSRVKQPGAGVDADSSQGGGSSQDSAEGFIVHHGAPKQSSEPRASTTASPDYDVGGSVDCGSGPRSGGDGTGSATATSTSTNRGADVAARGARGDSGLVSQPKADMEDVSIMSSTERKLCRRGLEACSRKPVELYGLDSTVDVLVLEKGCGEEVLTAVGLHVESIFDRLETTQVRSHDTVAKALEKIRQCKPKLLLMRPPDHMTRTRGSAHMVRTYHARYRAAYTRLVVACCAEQCCEGR